MEKQESDAGFSLVPRPPQELAAPQTTQNRILNEIVESSLGLVKKYAIGHVATDIDEPIASIRESAEKGDPRAQFDLGEAFLVGRGVEPDKNEAIKWYCESAKSNFVEAIIKLARINDGEPGFDPNYEEAFRWYKKAAELGSPYAQYCVGTCYGWGHGVPKDEVEGARYFLKAAQQKPLGFSVAQHALGICYKSGKGVPEDHEEAVRWFRKAAEQGLSDAQCELGDSYRLGNGTPKDFEAAARWYEKAAEQGDAIAQNNIGFCYNRGIGVPQDMFQAYKWFQLAADAELEAAQKEVIALKALMSASELKAADRLYREFKQMHPAKQ